MDQVDKDTNQTTQHDSEPVLGSSSGSTRWGRLVPGFAQQFSRFAPVIVLIVLVIVVGVVERDFLEPSNLRVVMEGTTPILLLALGQTFVILIGGIDLSNAALASFSGIIVALLLPEWGVLAIFVALGIGLTAGSVQGAIHDIGQIPSLIITLIGLSVWSGLALAFSDGETIRPEAGMHIIEWLGDRHLIVSSGLVIALLLVVVASVILTRTILGRRIYAVGSNQLVALLSGVPVRMVRIAAFGLSGLFAALTGLLLLAELGSAGPTVAHALLLPSLVAVLMGGNSASGGAGGAWQTLIGVLILGVLRVAFNAMGVNPSVHQLLFGIIVLIALTLSVDRGQARAHA